MGGFINLITRFNSISVEVIEIIFNLGPVHPGYRNRD